MNLLPSCSHYIRRILRRATKAYTISDLLNSNRDHVEGLEGRLHVLYPNGHEKVALHLEQLVCSYQQAQVHRDQTALQEITRHLLWWLGYSVDIPANGNVFIVDDTIETLKLLTTLLTQAGYQTSTAFNGKLALQKIPSVSPDLILLDINLPDIDGHQVYHTLQERAETAHIPVIFLSGIDDSAADIQRYNQHQVGYLAKPFNPCDLIEYVKHYIKVDLSVEMPTGNMVLDEFKSRQHYAQRLTSFPGECSFQNDESCSSHLDSSYFFRTTLDGRYLKVSQAFSQLYGYESTEDMLSNVNNLWEQCYADAGHRGQWSVCLQCPNEIKTLPVRILTKQHQVLDAIENIVLIQDRYKRNLFYQGHMRLVAS